MTWEREISAENNTFLSLSNRYWYEKAGIDFHHYGESRCSLAVDSDSVVYYNCDFNIPNCLDDLHFMTEGYLDIALVYRCVVTAGHSDNVQEISMCTRPGKYSILVKYLIKKRSSGQLIWFKCYMHNTVCTRIISFMLSAALYRTIPYVWTAVHTSKCEPNKGVVFSIVSFQIFLLALAGEYIYNHALHRPQTSSPFSMWTIWSHYRGSLMLLLSQT